MFLFSKILTKVFFAATVSLIFFSSSLFAIDTASNLLDKDTTRYDITYQDTSDSNLTYQKIITEVEKVAKEVDKIISLIPRVVVTGICSSTGCNLDSVQCDAVTEEPICPDGSVLNPERDMCQKDPDVFNCPDNFVYDEALGECVLPVECPYGGTYVIERQRCESPIIYECPDGYTEDANGVCISPPICPSGTTYDSSINKCEAPIIYECPDGWIWNSAVSKCERNPVCPSGTTYSSTLNTCISDFTTSCPDGYTYNSTRNRCEASPDCPSGYTYNSTTNKCEGGTACSTGTYEPSSGKCVSTVNSGGNYWANKTTGASIGDNWVTLYDEYDGQGCDYCCVYGGIYNNKGCYAETEGEGEYCYEPKKTTRESVGTETVDENGITYICKAGTTTTYTSTSCPAGYTVTSDGECATNPTCPSGGSFDGVNDKCYKDIIKDCDIGVYDSASDKCIISPDCFEGILDTVSDKCQVSRNKDCEIGAIDTTINMCVSDSNCTNDGTLDTTTDLCKDDKIKLDCKNGTDTTLQVCYDKVNECDVDTSFPTYDTLSYSDTLKSCLIQEEVACSEYLTWNESLKKCEAIPICNYGVYNPENDFCFAGDYSCPIDPSLECVGVEEFNHWCSPWKCNQDNKCGYAYCLDGSPSNTSPWMSRTLLNNIQNIADGTCIEQKCDVITNENISYCGTDSVCPDGFGVYEEDNTCYQLACPDGSFIGDDGNCYVEACPEGTTEQGDGTCK